LSGRLVGNEGRGEERLIERSIEWGGDEKVRTEKF